MDASADPVSRLDDRDGDASRAQLPGGGQPSHAGTNDDDACFYPSLGSDDGRPCRRADPACGQAEEHRSAAEAGRRLGRVGCVGRHDVRSYRPVRNIGGRRCVGAVGR